MTVYTQLYVYLDYILPTLPVKEVAAQVLLEEGLGLFHHGLEKSPYPLIIFTAFQLVAITFKLLIVSDDKVEIVTHVHKLFSHITVDKYCCGGGECSPRASSPGNNKRSRFP